MATVDVVLLKDLDRLIAETLQKVNDGVYQARQMGLQAELPPKIDFNVIVIDDWQALEITGSENGNTVENGKTTDKTDSTEKSTMTDNGTSEETQGGFTSDSEFGSTTSRDTGTETRQSNGGNTHTQNVDEKTITKEA